MVWTKETFLTIPHLLRNLSPDATPEWGLMTPQHMVEHLVGSWRISNGRARIKTVLPLDEVERRRQFLFSDKDYDQNITNPVQGKGLIPLRKENLDSAIEQLENEMEAFFAYHEEHTQAIETHPVFGELNYNEWLIFQTKHMKHHLTQFGLKP